MLLESYLTRDKNIKEVGIRLFPGNFTTLRIKLENVYRDVKISSTQHSQHSKIYIILYLIKNNTSQAKQIYNMTNIKMKFHTIKT